MPHGAEPANPNQQSTAAIVWRLVKLTWRYRAGALVIVVLQMGLLAMALSGLGLVGLGIDVIGQGRGVGASDKAPRWPFGFEPPGAWTEMTSVLVIAGMVLVLAVMRFLLERASVVFKALLVRDIVVDLRNAVYDKMQRLGFRFFDRNESGSIINRVTGDVQAVRRFIDGVMIEMVILLISLTFFLGYMLSIHVTLTLACLATTPILWVLTTMFSRIVRPAYRKNRELFDKAVLVLSENAQGVHVVKGFALQDRETEKFKEANDAVADQHRWIFQKVALFIPSVGLITAINLLVLLVYGGYLYTNDPTFAFGSGLFVFAGLLTQFSSQVGNLAQITNAVQRSVIGAQRVFEVLDEPFEVESKHDATRLGRANGGVAFNNVTFAYNEDGTHAIQNITFQANPGETIAILGATGSGKSTLLSLIPRFYDPAAGSIQIDGHDLTDLDLDDLRRNIGTVFQETFLFSNTVKSNIAFGHPEATQEQIEQAAKIAQAHTFVTAELDHGYDTVLTEGGNGLSGGQRQRLAIARALLLDPPILIMDDPTAAIDPETEHLIMSAMDNAMAGRTTFIVAHRLSTLKRADRVIVLEKGRITDIGTHDELMRTSEHYRNAAEIQLADDDSKRLLGIAQTN
ncbi:MAG: ABC transporter ATP-binding protein/permease [Phycisphaeraceae bacterium]|nr:ABC transporter ATP-binding protein/permease [Phycisphaeraceae bacterium]